MRTFSLVLVLSCAAVSAQASTIFTEGFNSDNINLNGFTTMNPGDTIGNFKVGGSGVDWIGSGYWQSAEGNGSVDMSALDAGTLSTTLNTVAGQDYVLSFSLAGNPDHSADLLKNLRVQVGNQDKLFQFDTTNTSYASMQWVQVLVPFTASGGDVLKFSSLDRTASGPALDSVTVADAVPEPAAYTYGLLGMAGIGLSLIRRRR